MLKVPFCSLLMLYFKQNSLRSHFNCFYTVTPLLTTLTSLQQDWVGENALSMKMSLRNCQQLMNYENATQLKGNLVFLNLKYLYLDV